MQRINVFAVRQKQQLKSHSFPNPTHTACVVGLPVPFSSRPGPGHGQQQGATARAAPSIPEAYTHCSPAHAVLLILAQITRQCYFRLTNAAWAMREAPVRASAFTSRFDRNRVNRSINLSSLQAVHSIITSRSEATFLFHCDAVWREDGSGVQISFRGYKFNSD